MKTLETGTLTQMPTGIETWQFLSDAVRDLSAICRLAGAGYCRLQPNFNDGGYVIWQGELLRIAGGSGGYLKREELKAGTALDGETVEFRKEIIAQKCAETSGAVALDDFIDIATLPGITADISSLETSLNAANADLSTLSQMHAGTQQSYNNHASNRSNPHGVTKAQVGLGNLPNAISDSYTAGVANTLATSKAVHALYTALTASINAITSVPPGVILPYTGSVAPTGWAICDGKLYRDSAGDLVFAPDLRGEIVMGLPDGSEVGTTGAMRATSAISGGREITLRYLNYIIKK